MCSGTTDGEMKLDIYVAKRVSLSTYFVFGHRSYTDLRDKLYYVSGLYLALLYAFSEQCLEYFLAFTPYVFPVVSHTVIVYQKKRRRQEYLLTRPQTIINFCDKTVIFHFKIALFSESLYFHLCNKNTESHGKNLIL